MSAKKSEKTPEIPPAGKKNVKDAPVEKKDRKKKIEQEEEAAAEDAPKKKGKKKVLAFEDAEEPSGEEIVVGVEDAPKKKAKAPASPPDGKEQEGEHTPTSRKVPPKPAPAIAKPPPVPPLAVKGAGGSGPRLEKPAPPGKSPKERPVVPPGDIHLHDKPVPEDLQQYQRGGLLKIRQVGNSRFSQEMTRYSNQLFIRKLGRGQYFVPDYFVLGEILGWAKKWDTTVEMTPVDDDIRATHMQGIRSKMSSTGEDLTKKVKDLERTVKMRDEQLIKLQLTAEDQKATLHAEIENLHLQLDQNEIRIAELENQMSDAETGSGAEKIRLLEEEIETLKGERDSNENLYKEAMAKIGVLQKEIDALQAQLSSVGKKIAPAPKAPAVPVSIPAPVKSAKADKPAKSATAGKPGKPSKGKGKKKEEEVVDEDVSTEDAAELDGITGLITEGSGEGQEGEEEPVDEAELQKAMAYKKPKWDDEDEGVEVQEIEDDVEMTEEELEEYEREQKRREQEMDGDSSDEE